MICKNCREDGSDHPHEDWLNLNPTTGVRETNTRCDCQCKFPEEDETVGQLYDRVVDAGGELYAYGYVFRTSKRGQV